MITMHGFRRRSTTVARGPRSRRGGVAPVVLIAALAGALLPSHATATTMATGMYHTCTLTSGGGVQCWGRNDYGQVGDGTLTTRTAPVDVVGLTSGVLAVATAGLHSCALTSAGGVKCWGWNDYGQLGDGTLASRVTPVDVVGLSSGVAAVAAGGTFTCVLTSSGGVKCWGWNDYGQLGDGTLTMRTTPGDVVGLTSGVATLDAGAAHACVVTTAGALRCWGRNNYGQLGDGTTANRTTSVAVTGLTSGVTKAAPGGAHTCAVITGGGVKCWGWNIFGALGDGTTTTRLTPVDVIGLASGIATVAAGPYHTCALTSGGGVRCWGWNDYGQVGDGTTTDRLVPGYVVSLGSGVVEMTAGLGHTCAATGAGGAKCWGDNTYGQVGDGTLTTRFLPVGVAGLTSGVATVALGSYHTCAVTGAGGVKCWGSNYFGALGDGTTTNRWSPGDVLGLTTGVTAVAAFSSYTCALTSTGGMKCWGSNSSGQLGDGTTTDRLTPVDVVGLTSGVSVAAAGGGHTCAVTSAGGVKCWGYNATGQLGDGTTTDRLTPVDVVGLSSGVVAVRAGDLHTCALTSTGGVKCWGDGTYGQLGDGTPNDRATPVDVVGLTSGAVALAAGSRHTCALTSAGGVKCWGNNVYGQLGDGTTTSHLTPGDVVGLTNAAAGVTAGPYHTCALTSVGGVRCWGYNTYGQLGDGTTIDRVTPVDVFDLTSGVIASEAGGYHTCALTSEGGVKCWGNNGSGEVGDGTTTGRSTPVWVTGFGTTRVIGLTGDLAFGSVVVGATATRTLTISNTGDGPLTMTGISYPPGFSGAWSGTIPAGGSRDVTVTFAPVALTTYGGTVTVSADHTSGTNTATASGAGIAPPTRIIGLSGDLAFGNVAAGTTATRTLTISNTGTGTLAVSGISYPPRFSGAWSGTIPAGGSQDVTVTFAPIVSASHGGTITVSGDQTSGTNTIAASGLGFMASGVVSIAAGGAHTCAVTSGGSATCWGYNYFGQLGDGTTTQRLTPAAVSGLASGAASVAGGGDFTCGLTDAQGVKCWGRNVQGQLGDGSLVNRVTPVDVVGLASGIGAVDAGDVHACALTSAGGVKCWGGNVVGQLGDGTTTTRLTPVDVIGLTSGVTQVAAGGAHTCALTGAGGVKCWGENTRGQLGDGTTTERHTAVDVVGLTSGVVALSAGNEHTCAVTAAGGVKCWGVNSIGQLGDGTSGNIRLTPVDVVSLTSGAAAVAAGYGHTCALTSAGGARCWGRNDFGQLGDGTTTGRLTPVDVVGLMGGVAAVAPSYYHTCALTSAGGVTCWGGNSQGQLGDGTTTGQLTPVGVAGLGVNRAIGLSGDLAFGSVPVGSTATRILTISNTGDGPLSVSGINYPARFSGDWSGTIPAGGSHAVTVTFAPLVAVRYSGTVTVSGDQTSGTNTTAASGAGYLAGGLVAVTAGAAHTCALTSGGAVQCWGVNDLGQVGNGTSTIAELTAVPVSGLGSGVVAMSAGNGHTCAVTNGGGVKCWGYNGWGQLGDGTGGDRWTPVDVVGLTSGVVAVAAGTGHTCALTTGGAVLCWGYNEFGQVGDGTTTQRLTPVAVNGLTSGVVAIAAGSLHSCALTSAGTLQCWGWNYSGQLGDGTTTQQLVPVPVTGLGSGVVAVTAGEGHTCALTSGGGLQCWGLNHRGQLGDGTMTQRLTPVAVSGLSSGVAAIDAGGYHTCALTDTGGARCWGMNYEGQVGDGTTSPRVTPVVVSGLESGMAVVAAGGNHSCALTAGGGVRCWGDNTYGQVGDGTTDDRLTPVWAVGLGDVRAIFVYGDLAFGGVLVGSTATRALTIANNGDGPLTVTGITYPTGFSGAWSGTIPGGGTQPVTVTFAPVAVTTYGGTVTVNGDQTAGTNTIATSGTGLAPTRIIGLSGPLAFGKVTMGSNGTRTLTITNSGNTALTVSGLSYPPGFSGTWSGTIPATGAQGVEVTFAPTAATAYGGPITVSGDQTSGANTILALGTGVLATGVAAMAGGGLHSCALMSTGGVKCWGNNGAGELGDGTQISRLTPVDVVGLPTPVVAVTAGGGHTCELTSAGGVKCSGWNGTGQLGDGTTTLRLTPVDVSGLTSGGMAVAAGQEHTCALTSAGGLKCWGGNYYGQLGDGTTTSRLAPVDVSGLTSGMLAVTGGAYHTCGLTDGGGVKCWGYNYAGQLGDGTTTDRATPVDVDLASGVRAVAAGLFHTCALTSAGGVQCWGDNSYGQLGDGTTTGRLYPGDVSLASGVSMVVTGAVHTCALSSEGGVKCWGSNDHGELGDGTTTSRTTPVDVAGLTSGVVSLAAGGGQTCAVTAQGEVTCWGYNYAGQLGDGTTTNRSTPVWVEGLGATRVVGVSGDLAFGSVFVGSAATRTLTISNSGNSPLTVSGISYPAGFTGAWSGTIPAGGSHDVTVTFAPVAVTGYGGTVTVSADHTAGTNTIATSGTGIPVPTRIIALSGDLAFGNVAIGATATRTLTIGNSGNTTLTVSGISYPAGFTGAWSGTILAGGSHDVTVTFAPVAVTSYGGTVTVSGDQTSGTNTIAASGAGIVRRVDFDGDGLADAAVYRPASGTWFSLDSSTSNTTYRYRGWGYVAHNDTPAPGDFDGDGVIDPTVFRPATGTWFILESHANYTTWNWFGWGTATDTLVPGDYDGDGRDDAAVYRSSTGTWYIRPSSGAAQWSVVFGQSGDEPIAGDFDGDGKRDPAVYRASSGTWFWLKSSSNFTEYSYRGWGVQAQGDVPAPGDYDGDGKTDLCVFRPGMGTWFTLETHAAFTTWTWFGWGTTGDTVVPADYDGDGKTDAAVYRASTGTWYIRPSGGAIPWSVVFGQAGDVPLITIR